MGEIRLDPQQLADARAALDELGLSIEDLQQVASGPEDRVETWQARWMLTAKALDVAIQRVQKLESHG